MGSHTDPFLCEGFIDRQKNSKDRRSMGKYKLDHLGITYIDGDVFNFFTYKCNLIVPSFLYEEECFSECILTCTWKMIIRNLPKWDPLALCSSRYPEYWD